MSVTRLLLSGMLVASGLLLAAFTLNGYLDPRWPQRQVEAAGARAPALQPWSTSTVRLREGSGATGRNAAEAGKWATATKRVREQASPAGEAEPKQASFQWPWSWLTQ